MQLKALRKNVYDALKKSRKRWVKIFRATLQIAKKQSIKKLKSNYKTTKHRTKEKVVIMRKEIKTVLWVVVGTNVLSFFIVLFTFARRLDAVSELTFNLLLVASQIASFISIFLLYNWYLSNDNKNIRIKRVKTTKI